MLSMYDVFSTKKDVKAKYYRIGYSAFEKNLPRDVADDLVLIDRAQFIHGWDDASVKAWNKHFDLPECLIKLKLTKPNIG